ncbi:class I SAM-dependent methyltransferase [Candidatus Uabimicrobium amorphum]|uniref:SAM-dependent methyltransferase n=1 Tax=Uabimicrobium amorphum TaxID=2596890 RepID=A0A5S9ILK6_UABAM|nr:class I SAM-dependent methyltransferase [Candidatus Uabimicrobium amorphum]BBM83686.1 SAM-dependent methyltransferase [Candidatus Uabimicrobium amorphum]
MRNKRSFIAHRRHVFYNPISESKIHKIIRELQLPENAVVVDIGCGNGEILVRIAKEYAIHARGVDICEATIQQAVRRGQGMQDIHFEHMDAQKFIQKIAPNSVDLVICTGSSHALGGYEKSLQVLIPLLKKNGQMLFAEGYWKQKPHSEYLQYLHASENDYYSHWQNVDVAIKHNLVPLYSHTASEEDFDNYEWLYSRSIEDYVIENPEDEDNEDMLKHIRLWRKNYLRYGRDTLGFALYLFRVISL